MSEKQTIKGFGGYAVEVTVDPVVEVPVSAPAPDPQPAPQADANKDTQ